MLADRDEPTCGVFRGASKRAELRQPHGRPGNNELLKSHEFLDAEASPEKPPPATWGKQTRRGRDSEARTTGDDSVAVIATIKAWSL